MKSKIFILIICLFFSKILFAETIDLEYINPDNKSYNAKAVIYSSNICITAGHVVDFKEKEPVILKRNRRAINGEIILVDEGSDIAIILLETKIETPTLTISDGPKENENVFVDSFGKSRKLRYHSTITDYNTKVPIFTFNGPLVEHGMSGSPIYDENKRLMSIVSGHILNIYSIGCSHIKLKEAIQNAHKRVQRKQ